METNRFDRDRGPSAIPPLRDVRRHRPGAARRPRRPQAGAAPHPVHDVPGLEPHIRPQGREVRQDRRRRDGQLPPARRRARSTRRWSACRRTGSCACRSCTARATSARSTATRRPRTATPRRSSPRSPSSCSSELDQETVDLRDNYAGNRREPVVLPAQFPNLLVNGTSGIAVGMATNIPPHNLGEVLRACIHLIENPDATRRAAARQREGPGLPARRQDHHRPRDAAQDLRGRHRQHQGAGRVEGREARQRQAADRHHVDSVRRRQGRARDARSARSSRTKKLPQLTGQSNEIERQGRPADRAGTQARTPTRTW